MINTAPPASNSVYGREKWFWYDKISSTNHVWHCGAVVKELLAHADDAVSYFCFFVYFFFVPFSFSLFCLCFLILLFLLACFPLFLMLTLYSFARFRCQLWYSLRTLNWLSFSQGAEELFVMVLRATVRKYRPSSGKCWKNGFLSVFVHK